MRLGLLTVALLACVQQAEAKDWAKHYRDRVQAFERGNRTLVAGRQHVVLVGDSLTEGWRWGGRVGRYLPTSGERVLNRGISSDGVGSPRGVLNRMDSSVFDTQPSHVFLLVGANRLGNVSRTARRYARVVNQIRARLPKTIVCVVTTTPARGAYAHKNSAIVAYNTKLKAFARSQGLPLIDLHALTVGADGLLPASMTGDGLHFNNLGYAIWGREIERVVAATSGTGTSPDSSDTGTSGTGTSGTGTSPDSSGTGTSPDSSDTGTSDTGTNDTGNSETSTHSARGAVGALTGTRSGSVTLRKGGPTLRRGDRNGEVGHLQTRLNAARRLVGEKPIKVDGDFGGNTERAVKAFQKGRVPETGVVDAATWDELVKATSGGPLGSINPAAYPKTADTYRRTYKKHTQSGIHVLEPIVPGNDKTRPLVFESGMAIDADGAGDAWRSDPDGQSGTSLRYRSGRSLNPSTQNFFVLPVGFDRKHPGIRIGDVAAVIYRGRVIYAIYGDRGPRTKIGEGSIALARNLGINPSPTRGGVGGGVTYVVFPGSGTGRPLSQAELDRRGAALLAKARGLASQPGPAQ